MYTYALFNDLHNEHIYIINPRVEIPVVGNVIPVLGSAVKFSP